MKYRPEIDGLRSLAILSVFIFHLYPKALTGGFLGVDVFFVISGYLISTILFKQLKQDGKIDFADFYLKRIKRIIPSLMVVLGATWAISYFLLLPVDFLAFAKSAKATLFFYSNFHFSKSDYFALASDEYPLLHTWSLSIEEQFYIVWPAAALLIWKSGSHLKRIYSIIGLIFLSSICVFYMHSVPDFKAIVYYSPYARASELLIGCLASLVLHNTNFIERIRGIEILNVLSLVVMLTLFFFVDATKNAIPGLASFMICVAAATMILGMTRPGGYVKKLLSVSFLRYIGQHSYPIYLWHWPLIALYRYSYGHDTVGFKHATIYICLTAGLSVLTKKLIEQKIYEKQLSFRTAFVSILIIPGFLFYLVLKSTIETNGQETRITNLEGLKDETTYLSQKFCHNTNPVSTKNCKLLSPSKAKLKVLLFGDSNAGHYAPMLEEYLEGTSIEFEARFVDSCPPVLFYGPELERAIRERSKKMCLENIQDISKRMVDFDVIILGGNWEALLKSYPGFEEGFLISLSKLKEARKKVIVLSRLPIGNNYKYFHFVRTKYAPWSPNNTEDAKAQLVNSFHNQNSGQVNSKIINLLSTTTAEFYDPFEDEKIKASLPFYDGALMYKDGAHLNERGSRLIGKLGRVHFMRELCKSIDCD